MFKEGCRIEIFADELRRRGEENQRNARPDSTTLSERSIIDLDNSTAEIIAKEDKLAGRIEKFSSSEEMFESLGI